MGPVGAELKFHRDAGHHSQHEVDAEYARPEPGCLVVDLLFAAQTQSLEDYD